MDKTDAKTAITDVLNISGDLVPEIDAVLDELLERGKGERVMILSGTEGPYAGKRAPYAVTKVRIDFDNERDLRTCVRLLRWSDDRLRARPELLLAWEWERTFREGMRIEFGVAWYDRTFFEKRKDAFAEPGHLQYYAHFGATPDRLKMTHEILGGESSGAAPG
jgi:hypothetical protein